MCLTVTSFVLGVGVLEFEPRALHTLDKQALFHRTTLTTSMIFEVQTVLSWTSKSSTESVES